MRKLPARKLLGAIVAAALLLPSSGYTLGLGEIEVNSALNQRLNADIELLSATPEDAENLIVKLASRKEFLRAGLDRPYLLNDLRFKSEVINGVPYIRVSSASPIREPFLNFLVEIDWPNGHLLREYTVLLDPPVFMTQAASVSSNTASQAPDHAGFRPTAGGTGDSTTSAAPVGVAGVSLSSRPEVAEASLSAGESSGSAAATRVPAPVMPQPATVSQPASNYKIKSGDTAWRLAQAMRPDSSVTVPQMMIAMLRTNPESFIDGNINGLKRGYILRVPDYDEIVSINQAEAAELVRQQAALWRQYQQSQAGGEPTSAMPPDAQDAAAEAGNGDAKTKTDDAYLEIVSAGTGTSTLSGKDPTQMTAQELRAELALARERVETELVEKEALQQRVDVLESNVNKMKGMLAIEDAELARVESLGAEPVTEAVTEATDEAFSEEVVSVEEAEAQADAEMLTSAETELSAEAEQAEGEAIDPESAEIMADESLLAQEAVPAEAMSAAEESVVFSDEAAEQAETALAELPDEMPAEVAEQLAPDMAVSDAIVSAEPQTSESGPAALLKQLQKNPMMLAAAGGGLLLFILLIGSIIKRRKAAAESAGVVTNAFDDLEDLGTEVAAESAALADESVTTDSQAIADAADTTTSMESSEDTIIKEAGDLEEENEPRDDVIAEADVYLAYGIYQQAEELLSQAIKDNPERDDYRVKLAETHYSSKNAEAFTELAGEIKGRVEADSASWKKVMSMGQDLCADNPMFQGDIAGGLDVGAIGSTAMDFDLGINNTESDEVSADLDAALDETALELPEMDEVTAIQDTVEDEAEPENAGEVEEIAEVADELEFDLSDTGAVEKPVVEEDEFSLDIDAAELDIDDEALTVSAEDLEAGDVEIDFGLDEVASAAEAEEVEEEISLDLTDEVALMDMDLGEDQAAANEIPEANVPEADIAETEEMPSLTALSDDFSDEEDFDLSSLDDVDEISTKLDLARAYMDMGDHEGTKDILEEVIAEGDEEQKQEASELMQKLG